MEQIITEKGRAKGGVSIVRTLATMEIGDSWDILCDVIPIARARAYASLTSRQMNRWYSVNKVKDNPELYTITRVH